MDLRWLIEGHEPKIDENEKKIAALEQRIRELGQPKEVGPEEETKVQTG
jgi:hypothetical protein